MRHSWIRGAVAACVVSAAGLSAAADTVDVQFLGTGLGRNVKITTAWNGNSTNVFAGQLWHRFSNGTGDAAALNGDRMTFCTEIVEYVTTSTREYNLAELADAPSPGTPMGATKAQAIVDLYDYAGGNQFATDATAANRDFAAAFQIAVWEIVYDYDGSSSSLDVGSDNLKVTKTDGSALSSGVSNLLTLMFNHVQNVEASNPHLFAVIRNGSQDQLVLLVPVPAPLALAGAGLIFVPLVRRRLAR